MSCEANKGAGTCYSSTYTSQTSITTVQVGAELIGISAHYGDIVPMVIGPVGQITDTPLDLHPVAHKLLSFPVPL